MFIPSLRIERRFESIIAAISIAAVLLCFSAATALAESAPLATVKIGTSKVLTTLRKEAGNKEQRRSDIRTIVDQYFDFNEMSKRALGHHWNNQPPAKREEFAKAFSQFLFNTYIDRIEKFTNEKITYKAGPVQGNYAVVDAWVKGAPSGEIAIQYNLHRKDGQWKAYDVSVEGVDLVNNYRAQFNSILARSSFDDLLNRLKQKNLQG